VEPGLYHVPLHDAVTATASNNCAINLPVPPGRTTPGSHPIRNNFDVCFASSSAHSSTSGPPQTQ
jgi:hypothetical protein